MDRLKFLELLLFFLIALLNSSAAADWPQWRGKNRDGAWSETDVLRVLPRGGLEICWKARVGPGWSSPVIMQEQVYLTDVELRRQSNAVERVLCFDESNGKLIWKHEYAVAYPAWAFTTNNTGPRATPIVAAGKLYTLGAMGDLFCFQSVSGRVIWQKSLAKEYQVKEFTGITASPLIDDKLLILYICGKPAATVVALNKDSGHEVWRALDDSFTYSSPIILVAGGCKQLVVWTQEAVTSLNPSTGATWWREQIRTAGDQAVATPVQQGNQLLVSGLMFELDPERPRASIRWPERKSPSARLLSNTSTPLLKGEYVFSARTSGELVCLDAKTGSQLWQTNSLTDSKNGSSLHLTECGEEVFIFTDRGDLITARLSGREYQEISRVHLLEPTSSLGAGSFAWVPPAYANKHVFARNDAELVCASLAQAQK